MRLLRLVSDLPGHAAVCDGLQDDRLPGKSLTLGVLRLYKRDVLDAVMI